MAKTCLSCGSTDTGIVCHYCGTYVDSEKSPGRELEALQEFHDTIAGADSDQASQLLRNGFFPTSKEGLVEAGSRTLGLMNSTSISVGLAAEDRLKAITMKLKLGFSGPEVDRAVTEFEKAYKKEVLTQIIMATIFLAIAVFVYLALR